MVQQRGFKQPSHEMIYYGDFPSTFAWGATSSAYQVKMKVLVIYS